MSYNIGILSLQKQLMLKYDRIQQAKSDTLISNEYLELSKQKFKEFIDESCKNEELKQNQILDNERSLSLLWPKCYQFKGSKINVDNIHEMKFDLNNEIRMYKANLDNSDKLDSNEHVYFEYDEFELKKWAMINNQERCVKSSNTVKTKITHQNHTKHQPNNIKWTVTTTETNDNQNLDDKNNQETTEVIEQEKSNSVCRISDEGYVDLPDYIYPPSAAKSMQHETRTWIRRHPLELK